MIVTDDLAAIELELEELGASRSRNWVRMGLLLETCERQSLWQSTANSFSSWLLRLSERLQIDKSNLWRYFSAVREYRLFAQRVAIPDFSLPEIEQIPETMSPEVIELLAKISRAMPDDQFALYLLRVFQGDISRSALRATWVAVRPLLEGKTARGRGPNEAMSADATVISPPQIRRAEIITALVAMKFDWLGIGEKFNFRFAQNVALGETPQGNELELDAVLTIVRIKPSTAEFHGFLITATSKLHDTPAYKKLAQYCDYLWLVTDTEMDGEPRDAPSFVGLLSYVAGTFVRQRPASNRYVSDKLMGQLARKLFPHLGDAATGPKP